MFFWEPIPREDLGRLRESIFGLHWLLPFLASEFSMERHYKLGGLQSREIEWSCWKQHYLPAGNKASVAPGRFFERRARRAFSDWWLQRICCFYWLEKKEEEKNKKTELLKENAKQILPQPIYPVHLFL